MFFMKIKIVLWYDRQDLNCATYHNFLIKKSLDFNTYL